MSYKKKIKKENSKTFRNAFVSKTHLFLLSFEVADNNSLLSTMTCHSEEVICESANFLLNLFYLFKHCKKAAKICDENTFIEKTGKWKLCKIPISILFPFEIVAVSMPFYVPWCHMRFYYFSISFLTKNNIRLFVMGT